MWQDQSKCSIYAIFFIFFILQLMFSLIGAWDCAISNPESPPWTVPDAFRDTKPRNDIWELSFLATHWEDQTRLHSFNIPSSASQAPYIKRHVKHGVISNYNSTKIKLQNKVRTEDNCYFGRLLWLEDTEAACLGI